MSLLSCSEAEGLVGAKAPAEQADRVVGLDYDSQRRIRIIDELIEENNPRIEQLADEYSAKLEFYEEEIARLLDDRASEERVRLIEREKEGLVDEFHRAIAPYIKLKEI